MAVEHDASPTTAMVAAQPTVEGLIVSAIEHGASTEALERLLVMRERLKAERAREAFFEALSAFQAECPVIPKRKTARVESRSGGSYTYHYAPLEDIVATVTPLLREHGLSYRFDTRFEDSPPAQVVRCIVHHRDGHTEESEFRTPVDSGARMNVMQQSASAQTYAKRYAFCNALGILTGDDDNDGHTGGPSGRNASERHRVAGPDRGGDRLGDSPGGFGGNPAAVAAPIGGKNVVRIERPTPDEPPRPADEPAESGSEKLSPRAQEALEHRALARECVELASIVEINDRRKRGQEVPPDEVILPIASGRCDAWLSRSGATGMNIHNASTMQLEGLRRVLQRLVDDANRGAA